MTHKHTYKAYPEQIMVDAYTDERNKIDKAKEVIENS
jgi:hypothetical protein